MAWQIEFSDAADRDFAKLTSRFNVASSFTFMSASRALRILGISASPCSTNLRDCRVLCNIEEEKLTVLVVEITHRSIIYQR
jgi:mRNA-degrading endonuclease RelE of RelBE toxin-antitoxin system